MSLLRAHPWLLGLCIFVAIAGLGYVIRVIVVRRLASLFSRTSTDIDDIVLASLNRHLPIWFILGGLVAGAHAVPLPESTLLIVDRFCSVGVVLSLSFAAANLGSALLDRYTRQAHATIATTSLAQNMFRIAVLAGAGLLVLSNLGISITPLLTALGVGSLAVALALQPTLSNLFAGLHIALGHPIRVGDFVQLESGLKGHVEDIGWRETRIRELPNNIIVVPNSRIVEMIVTNYSMPVPEQAALVEVGVAYGSDLEKVETVTCEVARQVLREVEGGVPEYQPFIRYHTFGESSIEFTVVLRVKQFADRYLVTHEFVKRLKTRYLEEGIEIPFPQRVLHRVSSATQGGGYDAAPGEAEMAHERSAD
jgi:small-conductance mechanosensitive channel